MDVPINYVNDRGECLPFADGTLDVVVCADVLEHVDDVQKLVGEAARVLRPGGLFLYEIVNRTWLSRLLVIKLLQDWPLTRLLPRNTHGYDRFPRTAELRSVLAAGGIENREITGLWPRASVWRIAATALLLKLGCLSHTDAARRLAFGRSRITAVSYIGNGVKVSIPSYPPSSTTAAPPSSCPGLMPERSPTVGITFTATLGVAIHWLG